MNTNILIREEIAAPAVNEDAVVALEKRDLLELSRSVLGYSFVTPEVKPENPMLKSLREMGHRPFTTKSADEYMVAMKKAHSSWRASGWVDIIGTCAIIAALILTVIACISNHYDLAATKWLFAGAATGAIVFVACLVIALGSNVKVASWIQIPIAEYKKPIPGFVLETAIELKQRCPGADIWIKELVLGEKPLDPFLGAGCDSVSLYLEVWDEPTFKGERQS